MGILHLSFDLRLLRCSFTASSQTSTPPQALDAGAAANPNEEPYQEDSCPDFDTSLQHLVEYVEAGEYFHALSSEAASAFLGGAAARPPPRLLEPHSAAESRVWFKDQESRIKAFVTNQVPVRAGTEEEDDDAHDVVMLAVGVASLLAFLQANLTGPQVNEPVFPAPNGCAVDDGDGWARRELMIDGCDLLGKLHVPEYLVLAKYLLVDMKAKQGGLNSRPWWAMRTLLTQQRCLAERSASLLSRLSVVSATVLSGFGSPEAVQAQEWGHLLLSGEARVLATGAQLEAGLVEHAFGHDNQARQFFERAEQTCGLELSVTGALGFRTIYQTDAKAQMVLRASSNSAGDEIDAWGSTHDVGATAKSDRDEILLAPKLVEEGQDAGIAIGAKGAKEGGLKALSSIEQAVILAKCLDIKRSNPDDELRTWQMAPYIEAVYAQQQSHPLVRALCELLRIRWERLRSRTRERAYLTMEKLEEELRRGTTKIAVRMCHVFSVAFPMMPAFLKEQAEMMVSFGLVGEAMRVFEELELWDNLIDCYCLLGKKAAASDLINQRLKTHPNDPRLWCSLGDVTLSDECYRKAWAVSNQHYARAQRSLGRTAYSRGDFAKSTEHWNLALGLNPLHPDGWFALGSAAVKAKEMDMAINAFTRSVQLNPDNGESWNNLAALNMVKKRSKEAFVAFREALKYKRNSWQMWENFAQVSVDVSNYGQAVLALSKVLELSQGKRTDLITLTKLVDEVEKRKVTSSSVVASADAAPCDSSDASLLGDAAEASALDLVEEGKAPELERDEAAPPVSEGTQEQARSSKEINSLFQMVGKLLDQVVQSGAAGGEVWGLKARWHRANGDLTMCIEAALKQVRALQGTSWQQSSEKFDSFAKASLQLCAAYVDTARNGGGVKELSAAIMHLRNTLKQGHLFSASDQYKELEVCLQEADTSRKLLLAKKQEA